MDYKLSPGAPPKQQDFQVPYSHRRSPSDLSSDITSPQSMPSNAMLSSPLQSAITFVPDTPNALPSSPSFMPPPEKSIKTPLVSAFSSELPAQIPTPSLNPVEETSISVPSELLALSASDVAALNGVDARTKLVEISQVLRQVTSRADNLQKMVAQLKLQNQLLVIEMHETAQRAEVEKSLINREVDRLRYEQIDFQNSLASRSVGGSDSATYRRRLQRAKLRFKDASKEIELRDKELNTIKKLLREGRLERESLEAALHSRSQQRDRYATSSQMQSSFGHAASPNPSTPQKAHNNLGALGMLALNALNNPAESGQAHMQQHPLPRVSAELPQFSLDRAQGQDINLPPLRLGQHLNHQQQSNERQPNTPTTRAGNVLLSPVAFAGAGAGVMLSPPALGSAFHPVNDPLPGHRRSSSTSTVSATEDDDVPDQYPPTADAAKQPERSLLPKPEFLSSPRSPTQVSRGIAKAAAARPKSYPGAGSSAHIMASIFREGSPSGHQPSGP